MFLWCLIHVWGMLQRNQVWNWINDNLLFSFSCSNTFSSSPVHLGNCSRQMGLPPSGLREWSQRVVPLLLLVTKTWLMLLLLLLTTADYSSRDLSSFSQFLTLLSKPCLLSPCDVALTQTCTWTSPPSLLACCFLISISPWLNISPVPNVLPAWVIAWLIASACCSLWLLLISQACTSLPGYLQPPWPVRWREECLCA